MLADITSKFYSLIVGGLFMLVVYHFLLYTQNKKNIYLHYSGYMLFIALYIFSSNFKDIFGRALLNFNGTFLCLSFAFYFQLTRTLLNTKKNHVLLNKLLKNGAYSLFFISTIFPFIAIIFGYKLFVQTYDAFAVVLTIYCIAIYWYLFRIKTVYARFILIGSLLYFLCSMFVLFTGILIGGNRFLELFGFEVLLISYTGILLEALIFALLIGYKTKEIELEKATSQANYNLKKQKVVTILKEQEIIAINAMIEGQEKERQRVASDLHDSVGATLAAAKLQFDHISNNQDKATDMSELFEKTKILLQDAYTEVREMANIKNSGVIAKNGLLPAIKKLTENVSITGDLKVELKDFGLENRLENSLEITIFRIIQELITNIIKHANASEAYINITQHETSLSIIIEDNGNGFHVSEIINKPNGMGLSSIEKRIEHLEGTLEIDSTLGKGTSILIDLPL